MKNSLRFWLLLLAVGVTLVALAVVPGSPGRTVGIVAAQNAIGPEGDAPPAGSVSPALPLVRLPAAPGGAGIARPVQAAVAPDHVYQIDMNQLGVQPEPDAASAREKADAGRPGGLPLAPDSNALGTNNTFLSVSPDVARLATTAAVATIGTGFRPFEIVIYSLNGGPSAYLQANDHGAIFASITTGGTSGFVWIKAQGLYSGKLTGGVVQISATAPAVPGLAVGPHAVHAGDMLYMLGVRYSAGSTVLVYRNTNLVDTVAVLNDGTTRLINVTVGSGPDGSAVYYSYQSDNPVGSVAGQSIEERADSGPLAPASDQNATRAFVDRAVLSSTITTTLGLVGEGFIAGETVNFTRQPGPPIAPGTADANGAVTFLVQSPPGANLYDIQLTGTTSGRLAYASLLADPRAYNVPATILAPSRGTSGGNVTIVFTKFAPFQTGAIRVDGNVLGAVTTNSDGFGSLSIAKPNVPPLVHNIAFSETTGLNIASAPLLLVNTGTVVGTVRDAVSGLPIKATLRINGDGSAAVQSDPTAGGVYTVTYQAGNTNLSVVASGCYVPQQVPVNVAPDSTTTVNVAMVRSGYDANGYSCYDNAGRAYTPATNQVFGNTFNENAANFALPFSVYLYSTTVNTGTISSNGFITLGNQFTCPTDCFSQNQNIPSPGLPNGIIAANWDDLAGNSSDPNSGVFTSIIGTAPNRTFIVEWRNFTDFNDATSVINTVELQLDEATGDIYLVYPTFNVGRSDGREGSIGTENQSGTIGKQHQANTGSGPAQEVTNYLWAGNSVRIWHSGNPTPTSTPTITPTPRDTFTPAPTPTSTPETCRTDGNYVQLHSNGASLVPGTQDIGNHGDNVTTTLTLPFAYQLYDQTFTQATVSSNGTLAFVTNVIDPNNTCLPNGALNYAVFPYWDDLRTDGAGGAAGIFTSVTGNAPNRIFNIEWRSCIFAVGGCNSVDTNFEVRLYEGQQKLDLVYGPLLQAGNGASVGLQKGNGSLSRQYSCNTPILVPGLDITYLQVPCATPTITRTPTITPTPTKTYTVTPIPTLPQQTLTPVSVCPGVNTHYFALAMTGNQEVPPNNSPATGQGTFVLDSSNTMTFFVTYQGLVDVETSAAVQIGAPHVVGAVITQLPTGSPKNGSFAFPASQLANLFAGNVYVNIVSRAFPNGEIRGQLIEQCHLTPSPTPIGGPPSRTPSPGPPGSATATATSCPTTFSDVPPGAYFYTPVEFLACRQVVSGYSDGTFRPFNTTTRGQMVKIVAAAFGLASYIPPNGNTFADVPPMQPFFPFIEAAAHANVVSGYNCGGPGEPCDAQNRPYFRPSGAVTRAQLTKITVVAAGWPLSNPATGTFADVPPNTTFYSFIETAYCHTILNGYACGGPGEPCDPQNRPYFRQYNEAIRAQIAKIVYLALTGVSSCAPGAVAP